MLMPLLKDQPVLVDGQLLPSDDPRALLQLETLISNWLVRTAELIGAELLMPVANGRNCAATCCVMLLSTVNSTGCGIN